MLSLNILIVWLVEHLTCLIAPVEIVLKLIESRAHLDAASAQHEIELCSSGKILAEVDNLSIEREGCTSLPDRADVTVSGVDKGEVTL